MQNIHIDDMKHYALIQRELKKKKGKKEYFYFFSSFPAVDRL